VDGDIKFHQNAIETFLEKHFPEMKPTTVFIPLCGKSKDIIFFTQRGHHVVGVEVSEIACKAYFLENKIDYTVDNIEDFKVYRGKCVTIYCGDFFKLRPEHVTLATFIYDRAALIALPKEIRKKYVEQLLHISSPEEKKTIFLISLEYNSRERTGPPFSVDSLEIKSLYGNAFEINELDSDEDKIIGKTHGGFNSLTVLERVYLLNQK
jgi:thiopurine S-methyltransferase